MAVAEDLVDGGVRVDLDLRVGRARSTMILLPRNSSRRWRRWTRRREAGQEGRLLERGVAAADDRDLLVAEEEAVAGRAGAHAATAQPGLAVEAEPDRAGARSPRSPTGRGIRRHGPTVGTAVSRSRPARRRRRRSCVPNRSACSPEPGHQVRPLDPLGEARVVLDVAGDHQLAARRRPGQDDRLEVRPGGVDRRGQAGRPGADDDDVRLGPALARSRPSSPPPKPVAGDGGIRRERDRGDAAASGTAPVSPLKSIDSPPNAGPGSDPLPSVGAGVFVVSSVIAEGRSLRAAPGSGCLSSRSYHRTILPGGIGREEPDRSATRPRYGRGAGG